MSKGEEEKKKRKMVRKMLTKVEWMMVGNGQSQMFTENRSVSKFFCKKAYTLQSSTSVE